MKIFLHFIILLLIFSSCDTNRKQNSYTPIVKIDSIKAAKIDSIFKDYNPFTPGYVVGVVKNEEVIFMKTYGMAYPNEKIPLYPHTRFSIGSNSKQFTCMAILLLEEQGKLNIEDAISIYIPELPEFSKPITIKQLMQHTSGIMEFSPLLFLSGMEKNDCTITNDDIVDLLSKYQKTSFKSGDHFLYTNSSYVLLARIIEKVSDQSYADFMKENIFIPLRMNNSSVISSPEDYFKITMGFAKQQDSYIPVNCKMITSGATGIVSTLEDLIKWTNNFSDNQLGKKNQDIIKQMQTKGLLNNGDSINYGLGLYINDDCSKKILWHGGRIPGYTSNITILPEEHTSIIVLSNTMDRIPFDHRFDITNILFDNCFKNKKEPNKETDWGNDILKKSGPFVENININEYQGTYGIIGFPIKFSITTKEDELIANSKNLNFKLEKYSSDIFITDAMMVQFIRNNKGVVSGLLLQGQKFKNLELTKEE